MIDPREGPKTKLASTFDCTKQDSPIDIVFNMSLVDEKGKYICTHAGQTVYDHRYDNRSYQYACTNEDIADLDVKISALRTTLNNVHEYYANVLKTADITVKFDGDTPRNKMNILVQGQPYGGGTTLAECGSWQHPSYVCGRPYKGYLFINFASLSKTSSSYTDTGDARDQFNVIVHEVGHALGIGQEQIEKYWFDLTTGTARTPDSTYTKYSRTDKTTGKKKWHYMVHSPAAHKFAVERWGKTTFYDGDVPAGIEMDDGYPSLYETSKDYEDFSHLEPRIYMPDIMVPVRPTNGVVSKAFFSLLEDTGYWKPDYAKAENLSWGDPQVLGEPMPDFPDGIPDLDWPSYYTGEDLVVEAEARGSGNFNWCHQTRLASGLSNMELSNSNDTDTFTKDFKMFPNYYNPKNLAWRESGGFRNDFSRRPTFYETPCNNGPNGDKFCVLKKDRKWKVPECVKMICTPRADNAYKLQSFISINGEQQECTYEGEELDFGGTVVWCPKPEHICSLRRYTGAADAAEWKAYNGPGADPTPLPTQTTAPTSHTVTPTSHTATPTSHTATPTSHTATPTSHTATPTRTPLPTLIPAQTPHPTDLPIPGLTPKPTRSVIPGQTPYGDQETGGGSSNKKDGNTGTIVAVVVVAVVVVAVVIVGVVIYRRKHNKDDDTLRASVI